MRERYKLIYTSFDEETHIENVSYTLAAALKKLLVMQGEDESRLEIKEHCDDDLEGEG
jgi:hypothetical protein